MKTVEVNSNLVGKRVKGIFTSLEVTGEITGIFEDNYSKGVEIKLDQPVVWGNYTYENYTSTARKHDDWGNLQHTALIEDERAVVSDLNENEKKVLECMIENTKDNGGFILDELSCFGEFTINQLKGYASSLQKKGFVEMYGRDSYNDGRAFY